MRSILLIAGLLRFTAPSLVATPILDRLVTYLTGNFSTADQARGDQNFRDITLHVIPIWTDRTDGPWLYGEQILTEIPDHPYRQRIYQIIARPDGAIAIRLFDPPDPIAITGAWKDPALLAKLTPTSLSTCEGCNLILRVQPDGSFKGGTEGKACLNTLRGASYATTEITVSELETVTWERGYNASDIQVWGSTRGDFVFKKQ
jgi:hypothetical protein